MDENSVCVAMSQLCGEVDTPHMIRLTEEELSMVLLGRRYKDGVWGEKEGEESHD